MSAKKNYNFRKEQLAEAVGMKKVKRNIKIKRCAGKMHGKKLLRNRSSLRRCPVKKVFLEILQNSPENTVLESCFNKPFNCVILLQKLHLKFLTGC